MAYGIQGSARPITPAAPPTPQYGLTGAYNILGHGNVKPGIDTAATPNGPTRIHLSGTGAAPPKPKWYDPNRKDSRRGAHWHAQKGIEDLGKWIDPGVAANDLQAALSGARGVEAQQEAYNNFVSSPGQQFLQDRGEQAVLRNAAALGGLGGANVMKELQQFGQGLAQQDFDNYYNRIGVAGDRGLQAQGLRTGMYGRKVDADIANMAAQAQIKSAAQSAAGTVAAANIAGQTALMRDAAGYAYDAGNRVADNITGTTSALAGLRNDLGTGMSSLYGSNINNIANILNAGGIAQGDSYQNQANLLGNVRTGGSSSLGGIRALPQATSGNLGSVLQGIGGIGEGFNLGR